jgi:hypothetical protein
MNGIRAINTFALYCAGLCADRRGRKAVELLRNEWACMPGTSQDQGYAMAQLKADFDKYVKEYSN